MEDWVCEKEKLNDENAECFCQDCIDKAQDKIGNLKEWNTEELMENMKKQINNGCICYVKFTCLNCGSRQTAETPNTFHTEGYTCEECGKRSYPKKWGMMIIKKIE